jgi:hypothetical protein
MPKKSTDENKVTASDKAKDRRRATRRTGFKKGGAAKGKKGQDS